MSDDNPQLSEAQQWVRAVCLVTGWNVKLLAGRAAKLGKLLRAAGGTWQDLELYFGQVDQGAAWWYYRDTWQGKRGERPNQSAIMEYWGRWELPVAVAEPVSKYGGMLAYIQNAEANSGE